MKYTILTYLAGVLLLTAARNNTSRNPAEKELSAACYRKVVGKDTFQLQLMVREEKAEGVLDYKFWEKDKNSGVIEGKMEDNILRANYQFQSEGVKSDRKVVFKVMGEQVYEALADSADQNGNPVFTDDNSLLKFEPQPYTRYPCE